MHAVSHQIDRRQSLDHVCVRQDPGQGEAGLRFRPSSAANSSLIISSPWKLGSSPTEEKVWKLMSVLSKTQVLSSGHGMICLNLGPPKACAEEKGLATGGSVRNGS